MKSEDGMIALERSEVEGRFIFLKEVETIL